MAPSDRPALVRRLGVSMMRFVPGSNAESLAVVRVATCIAGIATVEAIIQRPYEVLDRSLVWPPAGTRWVYEWIGVSRVGIGVAGGLAVAGMVGLLIGFLRPVSGALALVGFLYVGWLPALTGKVDHHHHVLWFLVLVTVFPSTDQWSLERLIDRRRGDGGRAPDRAPELYAIPIGCGILVLGVIYLFPGMAKLSAGPDWIFGDNLYNIASRLAAEKGRSVPALFELPFAGPVMAAGAILFELLFLPLSIAPATQRWIRWFGIAFHQATWLLLGITFWTLAILYVVFFDWRMFSVRSDRRLPPVQSSDVEAVSTQLATFTAGLVVGLVAVFGAAGENGWPFSIYPPFSSLETPFVTQIEFEYESGDRAFAADTQLAGAFSAGAVKPLFAGAVARSRLDGGEAMAAYVRLLQQLGLPPVSAIRLVKYEWRDPSNIVSVELVYSADM